MKTIPWYVLATGLLLVPAVTACGGDSGTEETPAPEGEEGAAPDSGAPAGGSDEGAEGGTGEGGEGVAEGPEGIPAEGGEGSAPDGGEPAGGDGGAVGPDAGVVEGVEGAEGAEGVEGSDAGEEGSEGAEGAEGVEGSGEEDGGVADVEPETGPGFASVFHIARKGEKPNFWDLPFPEDLHLNADGNIELRRFPNPTKNSLLDLYIKTIMENTPGFGTASALYVRFDGAIDTGALPTEEESMAPESPVMLVDIDTASPEYGMRYPLMLEFEAFGTEYLEANTLKILPLHGFPLRGGTRYALLVRRSLGGVDGNPLKPALDVKRLLHNKPGADTEVKAAATGEGWTALRAYLDDQGLNPDEFAIAAAFKTQDPAAGMRVVRAALAQMPDPEIIDIAFSKPQASGTLKWDVYEGHATVPNFQSGDPPYTIAGSGGFVFDAGGEPQVQRMEEVRFSLIVPQGAAPAEGWPIAVYSHGTGGNYRSLLQEGIAKQFIAQGMAALGFDQVLHGPRDPSGNDPSITFFNFTNPIAGRDNTRQGGVDTLTFLRLVRTMKIPAAVAQGGAEIGFDKNKTYFVGHSQGSLTGPPGATFDPEVKAVVYSGVGGILAITVLERSDPVPFKQLVETALGMTGPEKLEPFHPILMLIQMFIEPSDPINYGRLMIHEPQVPQPADLLMTQGFLDAAVPKHASDALIAAIGFPIIEPAADVTLAMELRGNGTLAEPVALNVKAGNGAEITAGVLQFPDGDHYPFFNDPRALAIWPNFIGSHVRDGHATISSQ